MPRSIVDAGIDPRADPLRPRAASARSGVCATCYGIEPGNGQAGRHRRGCRYHRRAVHRRAGHPADHAYLPYRRRRRRRISRRVFRESRSCSRHASPKKMPLLSQRSAAWSRIEEIQAAPLRKTVTVTDPKTGEMRSYQLASSSGITRERRPADRRRAIQLTDGALNPHDVLRILGRSTPCHDYHDPGSSEGLPSAGRRYQR